MIAMPDPTTFAVLPWRPEEQGVGADVLRRRHARAASPTRATRATCCAARSSAPRRWASTHFNVGPELEFFYFRNASPDERPAGDPRRGRLLRPHHARRRLRRAPRDGARARAARHPRRVHAPRGRPVAARDRHALRAGAEDGRRLHDLPHHGQGVRDEVRLARDLHAEAAVRRERLGHAHAPVALQGRPQRVLRRRRPVLPVATRQGVHRRPAQARARDLVDLRPVGELLQAARAGLRGAGLLRLVAPQPLGARARAALPPRQGAGDAHGAALPRPGVQPVPDVRGAAARPGSRGSRRATSCPSRWRRTSTTCRPTSGSGSASSSCPRRSARRSS